MLKTFLLSLSFVILILTIFAPLWAPWFWGKILKKPKTK